MNMRSLKTMTILFSLGLSVPAQNVGFYIKEGKVYDKNDNEFIMRGINHAHTWYESSTNKAIPDISKTGANCVRVVLSNGKQAKENWGKNGATDVKNVIDLCKSNKLVAILEVHDCTGYPEKDGSQRLSTATDYWIEIKDVLIGQEAYVIINIANEPYGNNAQSNLWLSEHTTSIQTLRNAGFKHLLMVDGANWGQDHSKTMQNNAGTLLNADPDKNTMFSVHMYEVYENASTVTGYLQSFVNKKLPLCVGEFGHKHNGKSVDWVSILSGCKNLGIGYIGWSWSGNSGGVEYLDIVNNFNAGSLTEWGQNLINHENGIKKTSIVCSIFGDSPQQNKLPVVSISSPANNAKFDAPASVTIIATASDSDGNVTKVEFFRDAVKLGEKTSSPYSYTWNNVQAGTYKITAKVTDNKNASVVSDTITITVDIANSISYKKTRNSPGMIGDTRVELYDLHGKLVNRLSLQDFVSTRATQPKGTMIIKMLHNGQVIDNTKILNLQSK